MQIHPEFDIEAGLWFHSYVRHGREYTFEGRTISELLEKLRETTKDIEVIGYYPIGTQPPPITYPPWTLTEYLKRPDSPHKANPGIKLHARKPGGTEWGAKPTTNAETGAEFKPKPKRKAINRGPEAGRTARYLKPDEREKIYNEILDMWQAGLTACEIAAKLDLKTTYIGSCVIPKARSRNDPRAIVRNPNSIGITKNNKY